MAEVEVLLTSPVEWYLYLKRLTDLLWGERGYAENWILRTRPDVSNVRPSS